MSYNYKTETFESNYARNMRHARNRRAAAARNARGETAFYCAVCGVIATWNINHVRVCDNHVIDADMLGS